MTTCNSPQRLPSAANATPASTAVGPRGGRKFFSAMVLGLAIGIQPGGLLAQENQPARPMQPPRGSNDPVVQALLEANPTTPPQLVRAIDTLLNLGYPEVALPLVQRLQEANLDDPAKYALVKEFGSDIFSRISREAGLAPDGTALATAVIEGASRYAQDPQRLAELIDRLAEGDQATRHGVANELRSGGVAAANALLNASADESRADAHDAIFEALVLQGSNALGPATAAIDAPQPAIQAAGLRALGYVGTRNSLKFVLGLAFDPTAQPAVRTAAQDALRRLLGEVPSRDAAIAFLYDEAIRAYEGTPPEQPNLAGDVEIWVWDPEASAATVRVAPARVAAAITAQQIATHLYPLDPERPLIRRLFLSSVLERAALDQGLEKRLEAGAGSIYEIVESFEMPVLLDVLATQLREGHTIGATALVRILGDIGDSSLLYHRSPAPSLLAEAASHPDPRLRFAAVEAMVKLAPEDWRFPGASQISHGIEHFANCSGALRGVIADTLPQKAQDLAGLLVQLGYETSLATNGRDAVLQSVRSADVAFILIDTTLPNAPPEILIQSIRKDPRTAWLPIGLLAPVNQLDEVRRLSERFPRTAVFVRPHNADAMKLQMDELLATVAYEFVPPQERLAQAQAALTWLAEITRKPHTRALYDLRRLDGMLSSVAYVPELTQQAALALAHLGTHRAQLTLVELASTVAMPLASRQAAAGAFRIAVERDGVLLHPHEALRQYDRYNASAQLDVETQQVLSSLLDTIELPLNQQAAEQPAEQPQQPAEQPEQPAEQPQPAGDQPAQPAEGLPPPQEQPAAGAPAS